MPTYPFRTELPFNFQDVRDEFDRLLDRVWHVGLNTAPLDGQDWAPAMDVIDEGPAYRIRLEASGISADQIDVSIMENTLVVRGCKPAPPKPAEGQRKLRSECRFGSFCRRFEFPAPVSEDAVAATCKNGILEISVPKKPEAKGHTVKIKAEE